MRKITEHAVNAFFAGRNWSSGNTCVQADESQVSMFLHGNKIAWRYVSNDDEIRVSMCGWPTPTTRERLSGVVRHFNGGHVNQINHEQYVCGKNVDSSETYMILEDGHVEKI